MIKYGKNRQEMDETFEKLVCNEVRIPPNTRYSDFHEYLADAIQHAANLTYDPNEDYDSSKSGKLYKWVSGLGINEENLHDLIFHVDSRTGECLYVTYVWTRLRLN